MIRSVVIGAGIGGLVRGRELLRRGEDVRVLEASQRAGGVIRTVGREGFLLELGPNTVRPTPEIWALIAELGLEGEALLADPRVPRYVELDGALHALPMSPSTFFSSRLLSIRGKLRLLAEPFVGARSVPGETVTAFFTRRLGAEAADRIVGPFVSGIWAGDPGRLLAAAAFPALTGWEREHGSLLRGALAARRSTGGSRRRRGLLSFREGLEALPRALARELGERLATSARVLELAPEGGRWTVRTEAEVLSADRVTLAADSNEAARLIAPFEPDAARALRQVVCPPLAVIHLAWPARAASRPLRGFGHLVVPGAARRVLGAVWSSSLFPARAPEGQILLTAFAGGAANPDALSVSDEELSASASVELAAALGLSGAGRSIAVTRYPRALPQYDADHPERIALLSEMERRRPGLSLLGNYQGGVSVGDVVRNALPGGP